MSGRLEDWFGSRRWRVLTEADYGTVDLAEQDGGESIVITFSHGAFEVAPPGSFVSPLGSRGRSGVLLQEVGPDGKDIEGSLHPWGHAAVLKAKEQFHAIV